ncbi:TylF/MycF family methyltransferase [Candidatus Pelagibacter sp.]|nr:TylF/MycF family methyltransferase [Candidatus Pelagibacter sp.]
MYTVKSINYQKNFKISKIKKEILELSVEIKPKSLKIIEDVLIKNYAKIGMTSIPRLINTIKSCMYVVENNIPGDFVECGTWRGANGIVAKKVFEQMGSKKKVWLFDTFEGMTAPTNIDVNSITKKKAKTKYLKTKKKTHSEWCYASLDDVKKNFKSSNLNINSVIFVKGKVEETLKIKKNLPNKISVLRLDTDWYKSTKLELEILYPILSKKGVLIIDDYGHWEGSRKAVNKYFSKTNSKPMLNIIDYTCRSGIKI